MHNGQVLDITNNHDDISPLMNYLQKFSSDSDSEAKKKLEAILSSIDQVSSLGGQWEMASSNRLNSLLRECLFAPYYFFNNGKSEVVNEEVVLVTLKELSLNHQNSHLNEVV